MVDKLEAGERWQHVKRGTSYEVLGIAELQAGYPQGDHAELAIYRGDDGKLWARNTGEFTDGRFVKVAAAPANGEQVERVREAVNALDWDSVYKAARKRTLNDATGTFYDEHLAREVADRIAATLSTPTKDARSRVKVLEEALEPFAQLPDDPDMPDDLTDEEAGEWFESYTLPNDWLRRARAALGNKETDHAGA